MNSEGWPQILKKYRFEALCILPLLVFLFVFTVLPVLRLIAMSFQGATWGSPFAHYQTLMQQPAFRAAFFNTIIIAIGSLVIELGLGLVLALILSSRRAAFLKTVFMLPLAIPTVVVGVMMSYLFATSGWINRILMDCQWSTAGVNWMGGGGPSLMMVILADSWKVTPLVMLILLAGLNSIDPQLIQAATVDGAGRLAIFRRIILPLMLPHITAAVIIRGIDAFRIFELPLILMGENLRVIGTYAYLEYMDYQNVHLSAASALILFLMIMAAVLIYIKLVGRQGVQAV